MQNQLSHPAAKWEQDVQQSPTTEQALRLAAMAGHMRIDKIAARRGALIDLLADGRPHPCEEIWQTIANQLGEDCWSKLPQEALARDLAALRKGGIRIAYSRRPGTIGYYLQYPRLKRPSSPQYETVNWQLVKAIRQLSIPEKNARAFAAADFALRQKTLILAEENPEWAPEKAESEARRLVFGASEAAQP
ncbi:MAG: hypothetical protein GY803_31060 [Chloroflexi bacterium]|nr:hypothetical protein [Chloroflexota bacterium]